MCQVTLHLSYLARFTHDHNNKNRSFYGPGTCHTLKEETIYGRYNTGHGTPYMSILGLHVWMFGYPNVFSRVYTLCKTEMLFRNFAWSDGQLNYTATQAVVRLHWEGHMSMSYWAHWLLVWTSRYVQVTQKKGTFEKSNKNWKKSNKKFIGTNWTNKTCLLRDSNPNYQCLKITFCRWRNPPRMHSFTATTHFKSSRSFVEEYAIYRT